MVGALEAVFLGIVQGITEWLPVSSSAHLALSQYFLGIKADVAFDIVLHLGTLLAVLVYYRKDIAAMLLGVLQKKERELRLVGMLILCAVPTAVIGFAFKGFFESMFSAPIYIAGALAITGIFLLVAEKAAKAVTKATEKREVGMQESFAIGVAQGIAVAPGISRSGATIGAALILGIEKEEAAKFSFLAAMLPIFGASVLEGKKAVLGTIDPLPALLGFAVAAAVGYFSIALLIKFLKESRLSWFGYYCIALSAVVCALVLLK